MFGTIEFEDLESRDKDGDQAHCKVMLDRRFAFAKAREPNVLGIK